jgi:hypothetical protein
VAGASKAVGVGVMGELSARVGARGMAERRTRPQPDEAGRAATEAAAFPFRSLVGHLLAERDLVLHRQG